MGGGVPNSVLIMRQYVDDRAVFRMTFISMECLQVDCVAGESRVKGGLDIAKAGLSGVLGVQQIQPVLIPAKQQR